MSEIEESLFSIVKEYFEGSCEDFRTMISGKIMSKNNIEATYNITYQKERIQLKMYIDDFYEGESYRNNISLFNLRKTHNNEDTKIIIKKFIENIDNVQESYVVCINNNIRLLCEKEYKLKRLFLERFCKSKCAICLEVSDEHLICHKEHICCLDCRIKAIKLGNNKCPLCKKECLMDLEEEEEEEE